MEKLIESTENYETMALLHGDLKTAMRLNWLKNSMKYDDLDVDNAFLRLLQIAYDGK